MILSISLIILAAIIGYLLGSLLTSRIWVAKYNEDSRRTSECYQLNLDAANKRYSDLMKKVRDFHGLGLATPPEDGFPWGHLKPAEREEIHNRVALTKRNQLARNRWLTTFLRKRVGEKSDLPTDKLSQSAWREVRRDEKAGRLEVPLTPQAEMEKTLNDVHEQSVNVYKATPEYKCLPKKAKKAPKRKGKK